MKSFQDSDCEYDSECDSDHISDRHRLERNFAEDRSGFATINGGDTDC